jgi:hypothetical protein
LNHLDDWLGIVVFQYSSIGVFFKQTHIEYNGQKFFQVVRPYIFYVKWKKKCLRKIKKLNNWLCLNLKIFVIETQKCIRFSTIQNKSLIFEEVI